MYDAIYERSDTFRRDAQRRLRTVLGCEGQAESCLTHRYSFGVLKPELIAEYVGDFGQPLDQSDFGDGEVLVIWQSTRYDAPVIVNWESGKIRD